ncbi:hypothetical protein AB0I84_40680, partial [Streptomyces spectabilis]
MPSEQEATVRCVHGGPAATTSPASTSPAGEPPGTARAPAAESVFRAPYAALTWGIVLSVGLVAFESMGVATVLPDIAERLGGLHAYGWGLSALMLANLIGTVAAGRDDCTHDSEPGCAVQEAIADGQLSERRLAGHRK